MSVKQILEFIALYIGANILVALIFYYPLSRGFNLQLPEILCFSVALTACLTSGIRFK